MGSKGTQPYIHMYPFTTDGSVVKNLHANAGDQVQSLGREDPLVKEIATYSSIFAGKSHGWRKLGGHSPWGHKESNTIATKQQQFSPILASHPGCHVTMRRGPCAIQ